MSARKLVSFVLGGQRLQTEVTVPEERARPRDLLPVLQAVTDTVVAEAVREVEQTGQTISCRKGCGACCRQVVPVSEAEAYQLRDLVERMPEPRRSTVRARFRQARATFEESGLIERLRRPGEMDDEQRRSLALDYFRQGVACPFLEDESCSIWADRPLACREYLVTSPAENCSRPLEEPVVSVRMPGRVSVALGLLGTSIVERGVWWLPLILAPEWVAAHPVEPRSRPPHHLLREVLASLTRMAR